MAKAKMYEVVVIWKNDNYKDIKIKATTIEGALTKVKKRLNRYYPPNWEISCIRID